MSVKDADAATKRSIQLQEQNMKNQEELTDASTKNMAKQALLNFQKEMAEMNAKTLGAMGKGLSGLSPS
ncbi:hypothetical protein [Paracidovorax konjaci]|uniref:Uncharacterized protein n=1 Tax=Paracidovorax konjaci TaxID=32040 RepID=A0A1I1VCP0_9BURK|nr:hypothetical protein [Paracidovorax konjaci]SFD78190.1 hypothetical protein SAMN04489710_10660 [Paracidovorax konjaci]